MSDRIDPAVGVWIDRRPGEVVEAGDPVLTLHVSSPAPELPSIVGRAGEMFRVDDRGGQHRLVHRVVGAGGALDWEGWATPVLFPG
jgi:thymidine phosphorylase